MSLAVQNSKREFVGDAVTLIFETDFPYLDKSHIIVSKGVIGTETILAEGAGYSIDAVGIPTGTITLTAVVGVGNKLLIRRVLPLTQDYAPAGVGDLSITALTTILDKIVMMLQQINDGSISAALIHGNLAGGALHAAASAVANGFMSAADFNALYNHIANVSNPHGVTAAQTGAAPVGHVGSTSTDPAVGHPAVTITTPGFMSAADKVKLDAVPTTVDHRNILLFDDFMRPALDTAQWTRTLTATNPTASVLTSEFGVYRETTDAGSATSAVLLRTTGKGPSGQRTPTFEARAAIGATTAPVLGGFEVFIGMCGDPTLRTLDSAYFHWDGTTFWAKSSSHGGSFQSTSLSLPSGNMQRFKVVLTSTSVKFYVDDVLVATHNTQVPGSTEIIEGFFFVKNLAANARTFDIDYASLSVASRF